VLRITRLVASSDSVPWRAMEMGAAFCVVMGFSCLLIETLGCYGKASLCRLLSGYRGAAAKGGDPVFERRMRWRTAPSSPAGR